MKIINLLPKIRQQELHYEALFGRLTVVLWLAFFSFLLVLGAQLAVRLFLQQQSASVAAEISSLKSQVSRGENDQLKKTIKQYNDYISDFKNLSSQPKWSKVLEAFAALPPQDVGITSMSIDLKNKAVTIQGFAPTREKVIEFYNNIKADSGEFFGVDYPLENVAKPTDNIFHFTFYVQDRLLN